VVDDQITIIGNSNDAFSLGGDSGSLIISDDVNKNPVGLLFAGSNTNTIANRIDLVLSRFDVTVDNCSSTSTNDPAFADFSFTTSGRTVTFEDQSTDSDGDVAAWDWNYGDGNTSTQQNPVHTYTDDGKYQVTLTITDNEGATDFVTQDVTAIDASNGITLSANAYTVRNRTMIDLEWSGANSTKVDIYRNYSRLTTTKNDGFYTDRINLKDDSGPGSYVYQVCEQDDISICSNEVSVAY
jgi:serine protease